MIPFYVVTSGFHRISNDDEWSLLARDLKCSVFLSWTLRFFFFFCQRKIHHSPRFDAACVLEYDPEIDERVEILYTGFQTFRDL